MKSLRPLPFLAVLFLLLLVLGCGGTSTPEVELQPEEIIQETAVRMNELRGFHFLIERDGAPAFVDPPDNLFVFRRAEGDYLSPDRAQAIVRIIGPGLITDVQVVTIADIQWQTNPLTGQWEELPPNWGFDPTVLFDDEVGLPSILVNDFTEFELVGLERMEEGGNGRFYKITGSIDGERLFTMSGNLIGPAQVQAELWIHPDTFELHRVIIIEPETEEASIWQVDFSEFDQTLEIEPPNIE